ncbi:Tropomyosin alpha-4 chain [Liparis tanakae]|uniref:Tropomyosin alpha-4 chain n=1 Tax=Liparis tanakae TaxID=230148 RepID=A0A4Z2FK06_9TELE|nr:Tropomyosin alpha-4 chain [Liparis tanakae]
MSGGLNSIDAVKKKIKVLQEQAEEAEDRAVLLQKEVEKEKMAREEYHCAPLEGHAPPVVPLRPTRGARPTCSTTAPHLQYHCAPLEGSAPPAVPLRPTRGERPTCSTTAPH